MDDKRFRLFKKVLERRRGELKEMGLGNHPHAAIPLTDEDIERCWESGAFGEEDPRTLQNTVYFFFSNAFGWRGRDEQAGVQWCDLTLINEGTSDEHLKWNERGSKTRKGKGPPRKFPTKLWAFQDSESHRERCPIALYKIMKTLRSPEMFLPGQHLFLTPKLNATMDMTVAYKLSPMSEGSIGKIMPAVKVKAGITGNVTSHTVRKTTVTNLLQQGIAPTIIAQLTGHASVDSINNYAVASMAQQRLMSDILVAGKRPATEGLAPGSSLLKRARPQPSAAQGCPDSPPAVEECQWPRLVPAPAPIVLAPAAGQRAVQTHGGGVPQEVSGMFTGCTIQGSVNVHIHYGNVASTASSNTQVNNSPILPQVTHF